ncbi:hypothetical protein GCM10023088_07840 [Actinomadura verrucosospora]
MLFGHWGSRGRGFKSRRPDRVYAGQRTKAGSLRGSLNGGREPQWEPTPAGSGPENGFRLSG